MVSVLVSSMVDRGFKPRSCQAKDYIIGICCFSAKHTTLRRKIKYWLTRNHDNVTEWGDISIRGLVFFSMNYHYANPIKRVVIVQIGTHHHLTEN